MKVLFFTDVHGSMSAVKKLEKKAKKADILVCAGDISIFEHDIDQLIKRFSKLGKKILIVHGNHESSETIRDICSTNKNLIFLHKNTYVQDGIFFFGYGGGGFSYTDKVFTKFAKSAVKEMKNADKTVLVTHAPPYGTKIDTIIDSHCGNKSIRNFIKKYHPDYAISGHLHENNGKEDKDGKTRIINPGPYGKIISL